MKNIFIVGVLSIFVPCVLNATDAYSLLNIPRTATPEEIKKACRIKALEFHPEKHPQATEQEKKEFEIKFMETRNACNTLLPKPKPETAQNVPEKKNFQTKLHAFWKIIKTYLKKPFKKSV